MTTEMNNGQKLAEQAARAGIPERTVADVAADLREAQASNSDAAFASLLLKHGRLTSEAREFVRNWRQK